MPLFITFEGGEGCGKSYQSKALYDSLTHKGIPAILIREPGGTPLGEEIRRLLKQSGDISIAPLTELLLFNASRYQLVTDVIQPNLKDGKIVICDRFTDSTLAYQSYGRGLELEIVQEINVIGSLGIKPDITFLLDVPSIIISHRNPDIKDRFEQEGISFHQRVREGFLKLATKEQQRWVVINATLSRKRISDMIWDKIKSLL